MKRLRQLARDWMDGLRAARDVLLWGHAYPRTISMDQLRRMRSPHREPDRC